MMKRFKVLPLTIALASSWSFAADEISQHEINIYHELLDQPAETHLKEILTEGAMRGFPLPEDIKKLWAKPELRAALLKSMSLEACVAFKLLDEKVFLSLSPAEQSMILLRAAKNESWQKAKPVLDLEMSVYEKLPDWARNLIVSHHQQMKSDALLPKIKSVSSKSDVERVYTLNFQKGLVPNDLKYAKGDSSLLVQSKLSLLKNLKPESHSDVLKSYQGLPDSLKVHAVSFYDEKTCLDLLKKSKDSMVRAAALRNLLSRKWMEGQVMRVLKSKSWSEALVVYEYFCSHPDRIGKDSYDKYWKASNEVGKRVLSAFLWQHPKKEVSKTLENDINTSKDKMMALKGMYALPAHGKSDWLRNHVKEKKWDDELRAIAIDTLWQWKVECPQDEFYLRLFLDQGYRNGGPGVESLLKLLGYSKDRKAPKVIASFFKETEEPIVEVDVAIEAAGWHGSKEFLSALKQMERDGNDDPILLWAIERCRGKDLPFPETEDKVYNRVNPYFFGSSK